LVRIRDSGGQPETVLELRNGEVSFALPQILPGGKAILFSAYATRRPDAASIEVITLADRRRKTVSRGGTSPRYLATPNGAGYLVYLNQATLFAIPFDLDKLETRGTALPILYDVASNPTVGTAQVSFSRNGTLLYRKSGAAAGLLTVAWLDSAGQMQPLPVKPGLYGRLSLSPDGQRLALTVYDGSGSDIQVYDLQRDTMTRLTFTRAARRPVWSPDGRYIAFEAMGIGMSAIRSDGGGQPQTLTQSKESQNPWSFTHDGKRLGFDEQGRKPSVTCGLCRLRAMQRGCGPGSRRFSCKRHPPRNTRLSLRTGNGWPIHHRSRRAAVRFLCERFRTEAASGRFRLVAVDIRCGRKPGTSCFSRRLMAMSWRLRMR
jgi:hypothetical protein